MNKTSSTTTGSKITLSHTFLGHIMCSFYLIVAHKFKFEEEIQFPVKIWKLYVVGFYSHLLYKTGAIIGAGTASPSGAP